MSAVLLCADAWLKNSSNPKSSSDVNEGIKHLQTFMRINMDSGFHKFTNNAGSTEGVVTENFTPRIKTYGYCKMEADEDRIFYIFPDVMKCEILNDYNTHEIMVELFRTGHLKPGESGRLACKVRIPGYDSSQRVYAIKQSIFDLNFKNSEVEDATQ